MGKPLIVLVTGNKGKLAEVKEFLSGDIADLVPIALDLPEYQAKTVEEVSRLKAMEAYRQVREKLQHLTEAEKADPNYALLLSSIEQTDRLLVLVDDTALEFACLNQLPGPYIKWFLDAVGSEGLVKMTEGFRLSEAPTLSHHDRDYCPPPHRLANAVCVLSLCTLPSFQADSSPQKATDYTIHQFRGYCEGALVSESSGSQGFGWDGVFASKRAPSASDRPYSKTYGEMTIEEKRVVSHRGEALRQLAAAIPNICSS